MKKWMEPETLKRVAVLEKIARSRRTTPAAVAVAWILRQETVSSAIIGASKPEQVKENVRAIRVKLSVKDLELLDRTFPVSGDPV
jgi:aryl-alcohol dehydrogenase-like predicted oxidoreductase